MKPGSRTPGAQLTVAISTRSRPEALRRCLDALLAGAALPAEIVVVDQSRDHLTRQAIEGRRASGAPIVYLRHSGSGLGASQNIAIANASCPIIAFTDDDCLPEPDWVALIGQAFDLDQVDALTGRVLPLGPEQPGRYAVASRTSAERRDFHRDAMPWEIGSGNNFAVRRDWLHRIGGNDERLGPGSPGRGGVDMDLFYRLLRAGARIRYEPRALVYHQRTDKAGRIARRGPYGYGMGACCSLWFRRGDRNAPRVLGRWLLMRLKRFTGATLKKQWMLAYEEVLVLNGTFAGLVYGFRVGGQAQTQDLSRLPKGVEWR